MRIFESFPWPGLSLAALAALLLLSGSLPIAAAPTDETPPVLLRQGLFLTPIETAGSGIAPEVKVRITVDERGKVQDPTVLSIVPSSEFDELFRETAIRTLSTWRYAPATVGGAPVAKTLEWTVQFLPKSKRPAGSPGDPDTALDQETRLTRLYVLPEETQAERLRNFASLAESHVVPGAYRQTTATGWRLDEAKRAIRAGEAESVSELMAAGRESFYGDEIAMHYALSWLLVHYLRHGEPGWADEEFPELLLYVSEGYSAEDALAAVYGRTPDELEAGFRAYVRSL